MQEKLKNIAQKLVTNKHFYLWVKNATDNYVIDRCVNQDLLNSSFSKDVSVYLNSLRQRGIEKVSIQLRKKNGSGSLKVGEELIINLNNPQQSAPQTPQAPLQPAYKQETPQGLNSPSMGLSMPQIMDGYSALREVKDLKSRILTLESKLETSKASAKELRSKNHKQERKLDIQELKENQFADKEPSKADKFFEALITNPEMLPQMASAFKSLTGGLAGPQQPNQAPQDPDQDLSPVKKEVIASIRAMPDGISETIYKILKRYSVNDVDFVELLTDLLKETTLKTVADA